MNWCEALRSTIESPEYETLRNIVKSARSRANVYPPTDLVMRVFELLPLDEVKAVILGQDPYHGKGQANGVAFAVNSGLPRPPSLRNIMNELQSDLGEEVHPQASTLLGWVKQGVMMLNTSLTVEEGQPGSHAAHWGFFTDAAIKALANRASPMVFMLWGAHAKGKRPLIGYKHKILEAGHPSPLSVQRFYGCKHFSQTNQFLKSQGMAPIDWTLIDIDEEGKPCRWNPK